MKITYGQINTTPNDFAGNLQKIISGLLRAKDDGSDMVIFPELAICGYGVQDLIYQDRFVEKNLECLEKIKDLSEGSTGYKGYIVVGHVGLNTTGYGKPFHNKLSIIKNGHIVATYNKRLLPYYDVFSENRWFEPGHDLCILKVADKLCSFLICEDLWFQDKSGENYNHHIDPVKLSVEAGAQVIVSINSSPWHAGKPELRKKMLQKIAETNKIDIVYVNQIGGQDDLVFDGNSAYYTSMGRTIFIKHDERDNPIEQTYGIYRTVDAYKTFSSVSDMVGPVSSGPYYEGRAGLYHMLVVGLRDYAKKSGFKSIVLGSSGGIDSALAAKIACDAMGPENVHCIMMPSIYSSEGSVNDAKALHKLLGCKEYLVPIEHIELTEHINSNLGFIEIQEYQNNLLPPPPKELVNYNKIADENIQARIRGQIVMHYSNAMGALAIGTGNKVETAVGYSTIFGDSANCYNPLIDLYKTEIFALAEMLCLPKAIIEKAPSAELKPGQTDEATLLPYLVLDFIVYGYIEKNIGQHSEFLKFINATDTRFSRNKDFKVFGTWKDNTYPNQEKEFKRIIGLINRNEFKRRLSPMGIKVTPKSFGSGRRVPVVAKY